jgi:hypothetical protein
MGAVTAAAVSPARLLPKIATMAPWPIQPPRRFLASVRLAAFLTEVITGFWASNVTVMRPAATATARASFIPFSFNSL